MAQTTWSGPLASGDKNAGVAGGPNLGLVQLVQTGAITFGDTLVQSVTFNLPVGSQIVDIIVDALTGYDSGTSATLSAGTAPGGTQYVSGVNVKTTGRKSNGYSAAQLSAMSAIGTNATLAVTVTSVGQPTAGSVFVTVEYVQKTSQD